MIESQLSDFLLLDLLVEDIDWIFGVERRDGLLVHFLM